MKKKLFIIFYLVSFNLLGMENPSVRLKEGIISGDGFMNTLQNTPKTVYTITDSDIKERGIQSLPEALNILPGIKIAEGVDGNGVIDIRGQGKQYNRNIAIIVDGVRMNPVDWGNVNLYTIPVETIKKIEVIPSNASTLYGDNTVGGAINISTKGGQNINSLIIGGGFESYNGKKGTVSFNSIVGNSEIFGNYLNKKTDGYRENSNSKYENFQLGMKTKFNDNHNLLLKYNHNITNKRLANSIEESVYLKNRKAAKKLTEWTSSKSDRFLIAYSYQKNNFELLEQLSYQKSYEKGDTSYKIKDLEQFDNTLKFKYLYGKNKFISGFDLSKGLAKLPRKGIIRKDEKNAYALFLSNNYSLNENIDFQVGLRYQKTKYNYSKNFKMKSIENNSYSNFAFNIGGKYKYSDTGSIYLTTGKDFRTALTREMVSSNGWYQNIKPQEAYSIELGIRDFWKDTFISSSIFYSQTKKEIYFSSIKPNDPTFKDSGTNRNYDGKSEKLGYELLAEKDFSNRVKVNLSYSILYSKFKTGIFEGKYIPGVSKDKIALGLNYKFNDKLNINLMGTYYGSSYAWADDKNIKQKVKAYSVFDFNVNYQINGFFKVYAGIKNIGNQKYNERVTNNSNYNSRTYSPAAERNYFAGFEYKIF